MSKLHHNSKGNSESERGRRFIAEVARRMGVGLLVAVWGPGGGG